MALNDLGKEISEMLDASTWADEHAERVKDDVKGNKPYDIQEFSFKYATDNNHYSDEEDR